MEFGAGHLPLADDDSDGAADIVPSQTYTGQKKSHILSSQFNLNTIPCDMKEEIGDNFLPSSQFNLNTIQKINLHKKHMYFSFKHFWQQKVNNTRINKNSYIHFVLLPKYECKMTRAR